MHQTTITVVCMRSTEGYVNVEGGRIWYEHCSGGAGVPLLCIEGGPGFSYESLLALKALLEKPHELLGVIRNFLTTVESERRSSGDD